MNMRKSILAVGFVVAMVSCNTSTETATTNEVSGCPFGHGSVEGKGPSNKDWWPNQLDLSVLRQHSELSDPMGEDFDYRKEFKSLDYEALKQDIEGVLT